MNGTTTALCAAISIDGGGDVAPDWLHLLPAGEARTVDGRGPYRITDAAALMTASMAGGKLALDENHATDLAAPKGLSAPARGWIVELQQRSDGIWGRVDWTDEGRRVVPGYRGVSPAIAHRKDGTVVAIVRASLTNTPNITGLTSLHSMENPMDFRSLLIEALGLASDADDAAIAAALKAKMETKADPVALQAALAPIARAAGVAETADVATVLAGVQQLRSGDDNRVVALQSEVTTLTTSLNAIAEQTKRDKAAAFVDGAIVAGRVGVKPARDDYIALHMADPARAERLVGSMPILAPGATVIRDVRDGRQDATATNPTLLAQEAGAYVAAQAAVGITVDFTSAVLAIAAKASA